MHVQHSWVLFCFILAGFGILSEPLVAQVETKPGEPAKIQSTQADSLSREEKARIALQMFQEGTDLFKQQKLDAMKSAIEKFKYAQQMFNELGEKESEAWVWVFLGRACDLIGEKTKALEGYKNAFALRCSILKM